MEQCAAAAALSLLLAGLVHRGHIKPGEWLLVTGAAGGMGLAAVQLGKVHWVRVRLRCTGLGLGLGALGAVACSSDCWPYRPLGRK